ncbi:MAG: UDP-N-acetylmuramoyl-tripeptide--D-alanyl-D-alanine ligase [Acidobacteria bacterium]|nr:UDP-N-acetylmuramoyl-tripeptide--D-alanyl-D-alanine ligase [Acidobacteriota bacterium]
MNWTIGQVADALGAGFAGGDGRVSGYSIDSRSLNQGEMFFAVRAERDGHDFVAGAFKQGACAAVVALDWPVPRELAGKALLRVGDPRQALADLARAQRRAWGGSVLAVTGSSGKTTFKEASAAMLATKYRTARAVGNLNNDLGVPLTLLRMADDAEVAVVEMGMNHAEEIRVLARIAEPNIGVVTNVSHAHVGAFESIDGVALAKRELIEELGPGGTAVLNADDPRVRRFDEVHNGPVVTYGVAESANFQATAIETLPGGGSRFGLKAEGRSSRLEFETRLPGMHNVSNIVGAIAAAAVLDVDPAEMQAAVAELQPGNHRGQTRRLGAITAIDDCYNANPAAVETMLRDLASRPAVRRIAVLGEMRELGAASKDLHQRVGVAAAHAGLDLLVAVEGDAKWIAEAAVTSGMAGAQVLFVPNADAAGSALIELLVEGDLVLLKGSRGVRLERALDRIVAAFDHEEAVAQGAE